MAKTQKERNNRSNAVFGALTGAIQSLAMLLGGQLQKFGLTMTQFQALKALLEAGPMSQADLGGRLSRGDSTVAMAVRNLVKRRMVFRKADERDRRKILVHLTPEGRKLVAEVLPLHARMLRARVCVLRDAEQETLVRLCEKLREGDAVKFAVEMMTADEGEAGS